MKNDRVTPGTTTHTRQASTFPGSKRPRQEPMNPDDQLKGLHSLVIIMPVVIVLMVAVLIIIGLNQYSSLHIAESDSLPPVHAQEKNNAEEERLLMIVSPDMPLPADFKLHLTSYEGFEADESMVYALGQMMREADRQGLALKIEEIYVSPEIQHERYAAEVQRLIAREGFTEARASEEAEQQVPMEYHSEFQSGMAIRFSSGHTLDFSGSDEYFWLIKNAARFGFILRYPEGHEKATGFSFDASHFRYVGESNAMKIRTLNMSLDEYANYLNARTL